MLRNGDGVLVSLAEMRVVTKALRHKTGGAPYGFTEKVASAPSGTTASFWLPKCPPAPPKRRKVAEARFQARLALKMDEIQKSVFDTFEVSKSVGVCVGAYAFHTLF